MSWPLVKLGEVAPSKALKRPIVRDEDNVWQLNLDMVESGSGKVLNKIKAPLSEAGSSTHWFDSRHVLYSKLRPYLNKVVLPDEQGLATTELVPMLPDPEMLDRRYLVHYLRSKQFVSWISDQVAGAKMPRVSMKVFWEHEIPLPPLDEQKRIAAILDKADAIRQKRKQAIELADEFLRSMFLDMFGDPVTNPKGWDIKKLADVTHKITDGEHGTVKRLDSGKLYLMARNITKDGKLDLSEVSYISHDDHDRIYKRCAAEENDLLLVCVGATIGKAALVPKMEEFSLARSVALLKPDLNLIEPEFLLQLVKTKWLQNEFINSGNSSAQAGLYLGKIKETEVPIPPIEMQRKFKEIHAKTTECMYLEDNFQCNASNLFESLSQKAFSGQL
ncbi:restriction endonuclease subunit S [Vibrio fluvialis]|uniref:restriction endonuclease subunit S n=1 Tax=Vibrio fluvialis TaxID=676 RepID=UPI00215C903B|nr:restriction endonuclease subunit S [Vibrio fluvialis]MCR9300776.1 restriction endonuclease subunit S [Vibrio fluvialis]